MWSSPDTRILVRGVVLAPVSVALYSQRTVIGITVGTPISVAQYSQRTIGYVKGSTILISFISSTAWCFALRAGRGRLGNYRVYLGLAWVNQAIQA